MKRLILTILVLSLSLSLQAQNTFTIDELRTEWANEAIGLQTRPAKPGIADFALAFAYGHHPLPHSQGISLTMRIIYGSLFCFAGRWLRQTSSSGLSCAL